MAASVLNSPRAVEMSVYVVRAQLQPSSIPRLVAANATADVYARLGRMGHRAVSDEPSVSSAPSANRVAPPR